jgi:hypothetical protein
MSIYSGVEVGLRASHQTTLVDCDANIMNEFSPTFLHSPNVGVASDMRPPTSDILHFIHWHWPSSFRAVEAAAAAALNNLKFIK